MSTNDNPAGGPPLHPRGTAAAAVTGAAAGTVRFRGQDTVHIRVELRHCFRIRGRIGTARAVSAVCRRTDTTARLPILIEAPHLLDHQARVVVHPGGVCLPELPPSCYFGHSEVRLRHWGTAQ